jgi:hypothetical protein
MTRTLVVPMFLTFAMLSFTQNPSGGSAPGAYAPHPNPAGMDTLPPANRPPRDVLREYPKLVAKLRKLLPSGTTPQQACDGFKTTGFCVAAIHASHNLEIAFPDVKARVTGKEAKKLEVAIHELKPSVDAKAERKKAEKEAEGDIPVSN